MSIPCLVTTRFADQVKIRLTSKLIKGISRVIQKLLTYFNGTATFASIIPVVLLLFMNLALNLNDSDSDIGFSRASPQNQIIRFLNNCHYVLLNYTLASQHQDL